MAFYTSDSHLLREQVFQQGKNIKGWNDYEIVLYAAQRARMLGVNGAARAKLGYDRPLVEPKYKNKTSIALQEIAAGKFYEM